MPESEDPKNDLRNAQFGGGFINADTVNAQRIGGDIWNFFLGQQLALFWQSSTARKPAVTVSPSKA